MRGGRDGTPARRTSGRRDGTRRGGRDLYRDRRGPHSRLCQRRGPHPPVTHHEHARRRGPARGARQRQTEASLHYDRSFCGPQVEYFLRTVPRAARPPAQRHEDDNEVLSSDLTSASTARARCPKCIRGQRAERRPDWFMLIPKAFTGPNKGLLRSERRRHEPRALVHWYRFVPGHGRRFCALERPVTSVRDLIGHLCSRSELTISLDVSRAHRGSRCSGCRKNRAVRCAPHA